MTPNNQSQVNFTENELKAGRLGEQAARIEYYDEALAAQFTDRIWSQLETCAMQNAFADARTCELERIRPILDAAAEAASKFFA